MIIGLAPFEQERTCFSGQTCLVDNIQGKHVSVNDLWLPMDTCGVPNQIISPSGRMVTAVSLSGSSISWGNDALTLPGGRYRLCWCSGDARCSTSTHFSIDAGQFHMLGPSPLQSHTCVAGQTCLVNNVIGLGLDAADTFLIMDTCGKNQAGFPVRWQPPVGWNRTSPCRFQCFALKATPGLIWTGEVVGATVTWSSHRILALGGSYRLCWCAGALASVNGTNRSGDCVNTQFAADAGEMVILGPTRQQAWTCISSQECTVSGLDAGAAIGEFGQLLVLETCGVSSLLPRWSEAGRLAFDAATKSMTSTVVVSARGGRYRLCWCAALPYPAGHCSSEGSTYNSSCEFYMGNWSENSSLPCQTTEEFIIDMGSMDLLGPHVDQHMTCFSGQACHLQDLAGHEMARSRVMILDSCGTASLPARLAQESFTTDVSWASEQITPSGGEYRLCWCMESNSTWQRCQLAGDFLTDAGTLTVVGLSPLNQDRTCVSGRRCAVNNLQGVGLEDGSFKVLIMNTCGTEDAVPKWAQAGELFSVPQGFASWLDLAVTAVGGDYRLCWCSHTNGTMESRCSRSSHFKVDAGGLFLVGPRPLEQDRTCISGQTCVLEWLLGVGWTASDAIAIHSTCGNLQTEGVPQRFMQEPPLLSEAGESWVASWPGQARSSAAGGLYRLCWQAGLLLNGTGSVAPDGEAWIDMGTFTLVGPSTDATYTCLSGQTCQVDGLLGQYLTANDSFLVMETCASDLNLVGGVCKRLA